MSISTSDYQSQGTSEHRLQALVLQHLVVRALPNVFAMAMTNAARRSARHGARMKDEGLMPGAPDLVIVLPGQHVAWLELKTPKGRQSIEQKGMQARLTRAGHVYGIARSLDEAIRFLRNVGALR